MLLSPKLSWKSTTSCSSDHSSSKTRSPLSLALRSFRRPRHPRHRREPLAVTDWKRTQLTPLERQKSPQWLGWSGGPPAEQHHRCGAVRGRIRRSGPAADQEAGGVGSGACHVGGDAGGPSQRRAAAVERVGEEPAGGGCRWVFTDGPSR